jgi:tetratricopeptide (TPR) repeat protein
VAPAQRPGSARSTAAAAAALTLWLALVLLAVLRAGLSRVPSMHGWALNLHRFLSPAVAWPSWGLAVLALIPACSRRVLPAVARLGDRVIDAPVAGTLAAMALAAALVGLLPDRAQYVGDFLLRQDTLEAPVDAAAWYPQALPLDLFLHDTTARAAMQALGLDPNGEGRLIGAIEAALLAALALGCARTLGTRGAAALAVASVVFFGGQLTLFTGYNKAFSDLALLVATVGVCGLAAVRHGRGLLAMGLALAASLTLHRAAYGLLPFALAVWLLALRAHPRTLGLRRPGMWVAAAVPLVTLAVMAPRVIAIVTGFDPRHFVSEDVTRAGGVLAGVFAGTRGPDFANLLVLLSPLGIALPAAALALGGARLRSREALALGALVIPLVGAAVFIHPGQGLARDWDVFAAFGVAVSLALAWVVSETLREAPHWDWLALAIALGVAVPTVQWLAHEADPARGLARIEAIAHEPPARTRAEQYSNWQYLGHRFYREERWALAADAFSRAADVVPSPHILRQWAAAESQAGNYEPARVVFRRLIAGNRNDGAAWLGLAVASYRLGDLAETRRAGLEVVRLDPENQEVRDVLRMLDHPGAPPPVNAQGQPFLPPPGQPAGRPPGQPPGQP